MIESSSTSSSAGVHFCFSCSEAAARYWFECGNPDCPGPSGHGAGGAYRNRYAMCTRCASIECESCRYCHHALPPVDLCTVSDWQSELGSGSLPESGTCRSSSICSEGVPSIDGIVDANDCMNSNVVFDLGDLVIVRRGLALINKVLPRSRLHVLRLHRDGSYIALRIESQNATLFSQCRDEQERVRRYRCFGEACFYCETAGCTTRLLRCAGCLHARYCSKACQRKHWGVHSDECHDLRRCDRLLALEQPDVSKVLSSGPSAQYQGQARSGDDEPEEISNVSSSGPGTQYKSKARSVHGEPDEVSKVSSSGPGLVGVQVGPPPQQGTGPVGEEAGGSAAPRRDETSNDASEGDSECESEFVREWGERGPSNLIEMKRQLVKIADILRGGGMPETNS